jgi:hypothetical protein
LSPSTCTCTCSLVPPTPSLSIRSIRAPSPSSFSSMTLEFWQKASKVRRGRGICDRRGGVTRTPSAGRKSEAAGKSRSSPIAVFISSCICICTPKFEVVGMGDMGIGENVVRGVRYAQAERLRREEHVMLRNMSSRGKMGVVVVMVLWRVAKKARAAAGRPCDDLAWRREEAH